MARVLVACEFSGVVRDAFRAAGHDAWSCDLLPCEADRRWHIKGDVERMLSDDFGWDLVIAHPPCTDLSAAGAQYWERKGPERRDAAVAFARLFEGCAPRWCVENPVGRLSSLWRPYDQLVRPFQFGDAANKPTCLWFGNLPPLAPTDVVDVPPPIRHPSGKTSSRWYYSIPRTGTARARTFPGIAAAMAAQWGPLL